MGSVGPSGEAFPLPSPPSPSPPYLAHTAGRRHVGPCGARLASLQGTQPGSLQLQRQHLPPPYPGSPAQHWPHPWAPEAQLERPPSPRPALLLLCSCAQRRALWRALESLLCVLARTLDRSPAPPATTAGPVHSPDRGGFRCRQAPQQPSWGFPGRGGCEGGREGRQERPGWGAPVLLLTSPLQSAAWKGEGSHLGLRFSPLAQFGEGCRHWDWRPPTGCGPTGNGLA